MDNQRKTYKTLDLKSRTYRNELSKMLVSNQPVFTIKLETTGLDQSTDQVIKIGMIKCHFEDYQLVKDGVFERIINVNRDIPEYCLNILQISKEEFNQADKAETVMKDLLQFLGNDIINIVGFYVSDFIKPFLDILGFYSGKMLKINQIIDLYHMALSLLEPNDKLINYKYKTICDYLNISLNNLTESVFNLFNQLYELVPTGQTAASIKKTSITKNGNPKFITFETDCGHLALNCNSMFFHEITPDIFNIIDMDALTDYICNVQNCLDINEFIEKYLIYSKLK